MALTWDVHCKECSTGFQIYDDEAAAITEGKQPGPFCSDECLDKYVDQGKLAPMTKIPKENVPKDYHVGYRCLDCRTIILSLSRHSFVTCECYDAKTGKGCFVDGGFDYTRAGGKPDRMETVKIKIR